MVTSFKNKHFTLFSNIKSQRWDLYLRTQKELLEGVSLSSKASEYIQSLFIQINNQWQRLSGGNNYLDLKEETYEPFLLVSGSPILRHELKIIFFEDEQWMFSAENKDVKLEVQGGLKEFSEVINELLLVCKHISEYGGRFHFKVLTSKENRSQYETELREKLLNHRQDSLLYIQEVFWKEEINSTLLEDLDCVFKNFGLNIKDPSWKQSLHQIKHEDLMDLNDTLKVRQSGMKSEDFMTQHIHFEWFKKVEDTWKICTSKD